ncbi:hypothetical protein AB8A31_26200 [Tardiphaga sp. 804_B3_N1_9]|jgi:hypothetical protein|uniref:hypothetical protein n=1 Tax=Tardiphaga TaxID=1395974 RepID=UPI0015868F5A|nr:hypothetical protein [Tardiphaga robiniae]NUU42399.1 hypothetical protein [Tardiphaga robiniae]
MSEPSPPLEFIMQALASKPEERGCLFYSALTFAIGLCVAELWPFGGTQADVLTGYGIVVVAVGSGVLLVKWFFHSIN